MPLFQFVSPKEVKEGKHIIKTPVIVKTSASLSDIKDAIESHVTADTDTTNFHIINPKVYIFSRNENRITYACGNKLSRKIFVAIVAFEEKEEVTTGVFQMISHMEQSGAVVQLELLRKLRNEVRKAFASVDPSAIITD